MAGHDNKALVRRYYDEVFNQRNVDLVDELAVEDYVEHDPFPGQGNGRGDLKARVQAILSAFNPVRFALEDLVSEGDRVVVRWTQTGTHSGNFMGMPPTGKQFTIAGIDIHDVKAGRMAEHWHVVDMYALLIQLGALPVPGA
ncbi:MAG: ester cyclase [Actinomycetota bacterium]|nr:ester cyclase [Actinomycetota bacterium]